MTKKSPKPGRNGSPDRQSQKVKHPEAPPQEVEDGAVELIKNRYAIGASLAVAGLCLVMFSRNPTEIIGNEEPPASSRPSIPPLQTAPDSSALERKPEPFDFRSFQVDSSFGTIVERQVGRDPKGKSVIYMLDDHASNQFSQGVLSPSAAYAQMGIFSMLDQAIKKYGKISLLDESWPKYPNMSSLNNVLANLESSGIQNADLLPTLSKEERRKRFAPFAGISFLQGTWILSAIYLDQIDHVFPMNAEDEIENIEIDLRDGLAVTLLNSSIRCSELGIVVPEGVTIGDAIRMEKNAAPNVKKCGCTALDKLLELRTAWTEHRAVVAARREVKAALDNESNAVFVVAGALHAAEAIKQLKEAGVNYAVVIPKGAEQTLSGYMSMPNFLDAARDSFTQVCGTTKYPSRALDKIIKREVRDRKLVVQKAINEVRNKYTTENPTTKKVRPRGRQSKNQSK